MAGGGGVRNMQIFSDVIYGRPLCGKGFRKAKNRKLETGLGKEGMEIVGKKGFAGAGRERNFGG